MSERTKKITFAVFFVVFSLGMGYVLYLMLFTAQKTITTPAPSPSFQGKLPTAGVGTPTSSTPSNAPGELPSNAGTRPTQPPTSLPGPVRTQILHDGLTQAISPSIDGNGARFYNPEDGRFYRVSQDGTTTLLAEKQFFNVQKIEWGNQNNEAILEFPDKTNLFYDFEQKKQVVLPTHWEDFTFSPNDQMVSAKSIGIDPDNRFLIVSKPDGTEAKAVEALGDNSSFVHSAWAPNGQTIAYSETGEPQSGGQQEILFVGQNHENFQSLIVPGQDFLPNWSPSGKRLLFSAWGQSSNNKPTLWLSAGTPGSAGADRKNLNIQTWADKCAWADDETLYCAVPQNLPPNAGLQREDFAIYPDDVFRINLTNGTVTKISAPDQTYPVRQPVVSRDKKSFIFSDAQSGKLYRYSLK